MNKGGRGILYFGIFISILTILILSMVSAGFFDFFKAKITGKATSSPVTLNITIGATNTPNVTYVGNDSMTNISIGPNEGPTSTPVKINITAYDEDGIADLNVSSLNVSFSRSGEAVRFNSTCANSVNFSTYYANFTCNITMYWYDGAGAWDINASISDNGGRLNFTSSQNFQVGSTDGFVMAPTALTWASLSPGDTNKQAVENITTNNTGNVNKLIEINATSLRGESNAGIGLWAGNFTVNNTVSTPCLGTALYNNYTFANITATTLPKGNFTIDDKTTGQEQTTFCLTTVGSELTAQSYSTTANGSWTLRIVTST